MSETEEQSIGQLLASPGVPSQVLAEEKAKRASLAEEIDTIEKYYYEKLYHQLTNAVETYVARALFSGKEITALLHHLLFPIRKKLNLLRLLGLIEIATDRLEPQEALTLVNHVKSCWTVSKVEGMMLDTLLIDPLVRMSEYDQVYDLLFKSLEPRIEKSIGLDVQIMSAYHRGCFKYFKAIGETKHMYESLTLYLAYTPLNSIAEQQRTDLAFELCASGLIARDMFDFGDLKEMPVISDLGRSEEKGWILAFLEAAVDGNLIKFRDASLKYERELRNQFSDSQLESLSEKMVLNALLELCFSQPKSNRNIPFDVISNHCGIPLENCEVMLMRAMSLNLIKGHLDSISKELAIAWVKPRLVHQERMAFVRVKFAQWSEHVKRLVDDLEKTARELVVT